MEPTTRSFLYHEDQELSTLAVSIMDFHYEISPNWKDHYEGKIATPEELYREDVLSTMRYLKLRKIKRLMEENQQDLSRPHPDDELMMLLQTPPASERYGKGPVAGYGDRHRQVRGVTIRPARCAWSRCRSLWATTKRRVSPRPKWRNGMK